MPELPEVEAARRLLEEHCVGKTITAATAADDDKVISGVDPRALEAALVGRRLAAARRLGKHLWLEFGPGEPCLLLHFGMTGGSAVRGKGGAHYQRYTVECGESQWPPRFTKLELRFDDGTAWAFADSRRFARVKLQTDPQVQAPLNALGWDPLLSMPPLEAFAAAVAAQLMLTRDITFKGGDHDGFGEAALYGQPEAGGAGAEPVRFASRLPGLPADHLLNVGGPPLVNRVGRPRKDAHGHSVRVPKPAGVNGKAIRNHMLTILQRMKAMEHCGDGGPVQAAISAWERELGAWQPRGRR
jgi:hypothetical protein